MTDTLLNGYSGFVLSVCKNKTGYSFKKVAQVNSERLVRQGKKQMKYKDEIDGSYLSFVFDVPDIISVDLKSIVMKYCFGKTIIDFIQTEDCSSIDWIVDHLKNLIEWEMEQCDYSNLSAKPFKDKLKGIPNPDNMHEEIISRVRNVGIPTGFCHGDLTLSNMIFSRKIILVDFHDPFIETPIQDMVKLLQEVDMRWSLLMYNKDADMPKLFIAYDYLKKRIYELVEFISSKYNIPRDVIFVFHLMVLVRLLAYAKDKKMYDLILEKCKELLKNEKKLNSSYCW